MTLIPYLGFFFGQIHCSLQLSICSVAFFCLPDVENRANVQLKAAMGVGVGAGVYAVEVVDDTTVGGGK